jgi:tRNA nucleotidyltransferase (CCA-adding enzyme)
MSNHPMSSKPKVFLVGGAVRDRIMGLPVRDRDWVIVGATPKMLLEEGYKPVGKDFPVFLHPKTGEEYALARIERKVAPGYLGFSVQSGPEVTLIEDLARRDLTINAIAMDVLGHYVDPFGGQVDLAKKFLRHVSPAFSEDPVRILRVARFMARYSHLGFQVAPETAVLMRKMVDDGEVDSLTPERVWTEIRKSFAENSPSAFLQTLRSCGALARILPEVDALYGVPQPAQHHPEIDAGIHTEMVLDMARRLAPGNDMVAFAALTHDLGKALTPPAQLPGHHGHEQSGLEPLKNLCERLKVPGEHALLALAVCEHHLSCHRVFELRPGTILRLFETLDIFRKPARLEDFLVSCEADARGRAGLEERDYPQALHLRLLAAAARSARPSAEDFEGLEGPQKASLVRDFRLRAIHKLHGPARKASVKVSSPRPSVSM